jgi:hypothetical protein
MKHLRNHASLVILAVIAVSIAVLLLIRKHSDVVFDDKSPKAPAYSILPPSIRDFDITEYAANGIDKKYTVRGRRFGVEPKQAVFISSPLSKEAAIRDVEVVFYDSNKPVSRIIAKRAVLSVPEGKGQSAIMPGEVEFMGDVTVITEDHRILTCDGLKWDNIGGRIRCEGRCELMAEGKTIRGDTVSSDVALKNYKVERDRTKRFKELKRMLMQGGLN